MDDIISTVPGSQDEMLELQFRENDEKIDPTWVHENEISSSLKAALLQPSPKHLTFKEAVRVARLTTSNIFNSVFYKLHDKEIN